MPSQDCQMPLIKCFPWGVGGEMMREHVDLLEGLSSSVCEDFTVLRKNTESLGASISLKWLLACFTCVSSSCRSSIEGGGSESYDARERCTDEGIVTKSELEQNKKTF